MDLSSEKPSLNEGEGGSRDTSQADSSDSLVGQIAGSIMETMPLPFNLEVIQISFPVKYEESMNTVLCQELDRFNRLIIRIRESLISSQQAAKGEIVMSESLETLAHDLSFGLQPRMWKSFSYPSLKSLSGYVSDLLERITFVQRWVDNGTPAIFWLSGFFFTQSFLTGVKQNFARKHKIPIDEIIFGFEMLSLSETEQHGLANGPDDGAYVNGLFLHGCAWGNGAKEAPNSWKLVESKPRELFCNAPMMWFLPMQQSKYVPTPNYKCPVYKTSDRRGVLSTTGHSSNFVMFIEMPSEKVEEHWILRGVALLLSLDD
jgi:dynein heavy chain